MSRAPAIAATGLVKIYPGGVVANDGVSLRVEPGSIHAVVGENGAGKTTLMNLLYGMDQPTAGEIRIHGQPVVFRSPHDAIARGVGMVHQHFMLFPSLTVAENIVLGREPHRFGRLDRREAAARVAQLAERHRLPIDPMARVGDLPVGLQQRVEILKTLYRGAEIIILDEPTAGLDPRGRDEILGQVARLHRELGLTVILVSHSMEDVARLVDRLVVLHRGKVAAQGTPRELFQRAEELQKLGLGIPQITEFMRRWGARHPGVRTDVITVEEAAGEILAHLRRRAHA